MLIQRLCLLRPLLPPTQTCVPFALIRAHGAFAYFGKQNTGRHRTRRRSTNRPAVRPPLITLHAISSISLLFRQHACCPRVDRSACRARRDEQRDASRRTRGSVAAPRQGQKPAQLGRISAPGRSRLTRFLPRASDRWMISIRLGCMTCGADRWKKRRSSNVDARRQRTGDEDRTGDPDG